jgi:hypothetical protein
MTEDPDKTQKIEFVTRFKPRPKLGILDRVLHNPRTTLGALAAVSLVGAGEVWQDKGFEPWGGLLVVCGSVLGLVVGFLAKDGRS